MDFEINTYWNVDVSYQVLNGVSAIMQSGNFAGLMKLTFLVMCLISLVNFMWNRDLGFFRWFFQAILFTMIINMPIARVVLTDNLSAQPPKIVQNVPWLLAAGSAFVNNGSGWLVRTYETVFNVPDPISLHGSGDMGYGQALIRHANKITITDPVLRADTMQFFKECTIYDIQDGAISINDLTNRTDSWNTILNNTNPARFVTFGTVTGTPSTKTCVVAATELKTRVQNGLDASMRYYGRSLFNRFPETMAYNMYVQALGTSYSWLLGSNQNASDAVKQAMFNNMWREAGTELPALINDPTRVAEITANAGMALGATQVQGNMSVVTKLAHEVIPQLRNWLEAILYCVFPVVLLLLVLSKAENMLSVLGSFFSSMLALGLIPLFFAIINHISMLLMQMKAKALQLANGIPFGQMGVLESTIIDEQTMVGYMVILSVGFAGWLALRLNGSITGVGQRMVTAWNAAGSAGASLATGNTSIGEQTIDNVSANNTNMHKMDTSGLYNSANTTYVDAAGRSTLYSNGNVQRQLHDNGLHMGATFDTGIHRAVGQEASRGIDLSRGNGTDTNTLRGTTYGWDSAKGGSFNTQQGIGTSAQDGTGGGDRRNWGTGVGTDNSSAYHQGSNQGRDYSQGLYGEFGGIVGAGAGGGGGDSHGNNPRTGAPIGQPMGGDGSTVPGLPGPVQPGQAAANAQPGKPGKSGGKGLPIFGNLHGSGNIHRAYDEKAGVEYGHNINLNGNRTENAGQEITSERFANRVDNNEDGRQTVQHKQLQNTASGYTNEQISTTENVNLNVSQNSTQRASLDYSTGLNFSKNIGNDMELANRVARENGYTPAQFYSLPIEQQHRLITEQAIKDHQNSLRMPTTFLDGKAVENGDRLIQSYDEYKQHLADRYGIKVREAANYDRIGVTNETIKPLNPNLNPELIGRADTITTEKAEELGRKVQDKFNQAANESAYTKELEIDSQITRELQDKLGTLPGFSNDKPKK